MQPRDFIKRAAFTMRRRGVSIRDIEKRLFVNKSTLSYWFRNLKLHPHYQKRMKERHHKTLVKARLEAVKWHNAQKAARIKQAAVDAMHTLSRIDCNDNAVAELALSLLYLGEGMKKSEGTAMGNSDPMILQLFVNMLERLYKVPRTDMKCEIHIRADQNPRHVIRYWSVTLRIPKRNFGKPSIDLRTSGKPTYPDYKGVCVVRCARVAIQRKLVYIANAFCKEIMKTAEAQARA